MASVSISQYEATISVPQFAGLYQEGDQMNVGAEYAADAFNAETAGGVLRTAALSTPLPAELSDPIGTLMRLHRRWHSAEGEKDVLVAASDGALYWMLPDGAEWTAIAPPEGVLSFQSDRWSWVTYEINPDGAQDPVDVLLLSNAQDGMVCVRGDDMTAAIVPTPKKFGVIARFAERIWGGAIPDDPDRLVYSAPFDPFNWEANPEIPEDGAGDVAQPSWDGDSFTALQQFGPQLIAFKGRRVWRILGTDPGQYMFKEQYGGGAKYFDTVTPVGDRILMLGTESVLQYDGMAVGPFYPANARSVFRRMNAEALAGTTGCLYKDRYYLALPLDGATRNNAVLVYSAIERTWLLFTGDTVKDFLPTDAGLFFTSAAYPGRVLRWGEDAETDGAKPLKWVSPWVDLQRKDCRYGGWGVYLAVQTKAPVELMITIRTEKKAKTKIYRAQPPAQAGQMPKTKRIGFGGSGRRFRFEIESKGSVAWSLSGGLMVKAERDED